MERLSDPRQFGELDQFIDILKREGVRSYLEVGSLYGASLLRVASALPAPVRFVSVDLPAHTNDNLLSTVEGIRSIGHSVDVVLGDSRAQETVAAVTKRGPFDACFIDGDHSLSAVTADWNNYGPLCRIVGFHDIGWQPRPDKTPIEVPMLWNALKEQFACEEIRFWSRKNGIGILWTQKPKH